MNRVKFVGLDVHAETIAVAVAEQDGEIRSLGVVPNREESVRKLVKKLGPENSNPLPIKASISTGSYIF